MELLLTYDIIESSSVGEGVPVSAGTHTVQSGSVSETGSIGSVKVQYGASWGLRSERKSRK